MNLLLFNYSMNPINSVFSHQQDVANRLSANFDNTFVITAEGTDEWIFNGMLVRSSNWKRNQNLKNLINFYRLAIPTLFHKRKNLVVFSHMTEVQSFLIAPICWLMGIPHYLWYAHKSKSPFLFLSYPFLRGVITSTPGSCPIRGRKVHPIGQAIDHNFFSVTKSNPLNPPLSWYHVGRFDESKNIDTIIEVFQELRKMGWKVTLDFYGEPSSSISNHYYRKVLDVINLAENSRWISYHGAVARASLPEIAAHHDGFVHAFQGSLDKAVLEGIMGRRVVVSINDEFIAEFEKSIKPLGTPSERLLTQMLQALNMSKHEQAELIESRWIVAVQKHSLDKWIVKLTEVILK